MEMSQRNFLCSYLKQANMSFFSFYKIGELEGRTGPPWAGWFHGSGEEVGKVVGE
jgi:hypothetical protein